MKILHIAPQFYPQGGGIENFTYALICSLQARGHENCVVASHNHMHMPDETSAEGVPVHRVPFLTAVSTQNPTGILKSKIRTARVKESFQADVIHLHVGGPIAALHLLTETVAPAPLLVTVYDLPPRGQNSDSLQKVFVKAIRIIAISQIRLEECRAFAPQAAERMKRVYPGKPWQEPEEVIQPAPHPLILMTGRQVPEKGFDLAIKAFAKVIGRFPDASLVLVGDGPIHAELTAQVRGLGLQENVQFTGRIPEDALAAFYRQSRMTLVPSRHSESFGLVALEAMQAARPVIASRVGGLPEVVLHDETGLLFPKEDVGALADAMARLLENPVWAQSLGRAGQERARTVFGWETCVNIYESMYREACSP